jgi:hypothetical protein
LFLDKNKRFDYSKTSGEMNIFENVNNFSNDNMGQQDFITLRWLQDHRERIKEYTNELERTKINE